MNILVHTAHVHLQDMLFSVAVAVVYLCLAISMAVFSDEWKKLKNPSGGSGDIPDDLSTVADLLAASAVS